jgi:hypothetical protein
MSFLSFQETVDTNQEKKTKTWWVIGHEHRLGYVKWYSPWRRYVFFPQEGDLFDAGCLVEISNFLRSETDKQKETWK